MVCGYEIKAKNLTNFGLAFFGQGDTIQFSIEPSPDPTNIKKLVWKFSDKTKSKQLTPKHIFVAPDTAVPGQGQAHIKVKIELKSGKTYKLKKEMFISPQLNCEVVVAPLSPIDNNTTSVTISAEIYCQELRTGYPIEGGKKDYACGGACQQQCPNCEVKCSEATFPDGSKGTFEAKKYGLYQLRSQCTVSCSPNLNKQCIDLYSHNEIAKFSQYKPLEVVVGVVPDARSLSVVPTTAVQEVLTTYKVDNLAEALLPEDTRIQWVFTNPEQGLSEYVTHTSYVKHIISNNLPTSLTVNILIPGCQFITVIGAINFPPP